ncbi:MAG TPA: YsnF/AvaK domain-containing protein [Terriglobales bacterium]|nr:YsnF/AvaK domain-containing protein [Terriglobales bacterium]
MSASGNMRPPQGNVPGSVIAGYFKDDNNAKRAIDALRRRGVPGDQIGVAMWSDEIPSHQRWIADVREELGKPETAGTEESTFETFRGVGIEERAASHFERQLHYQGGVVVGVRCDSATRCDEVSQILEDNDGDVARDVDPRAAGITPQAARPTPAAVSTPPPVARTEPAAEGGRIQLMGEMLRTHKERINRGEVRLRKEVITEHQNISVPVTREEIVVESLPVSGATPEGQIGDQREIRIPISEEHATVEKEAVVLGEVRAQKREVTREEQVEGDVRHEELRVEEIGDVEGAVEDRTRGVTDRTKNIADRAKNAVEDKIKNIADKGKRAA